MGFWLAQLTLYARGNRVQKQNVNDFMIFNERETILKTLEFEAIWWSYKKIKYMQTTSNPKISC